MKLNRNKKLPAHEDLWLITTGRDSSLDLSEIFNGFQPCSLIEYRISDIVRYMLDPGPVRVKEKLVGCEVYYRRSWLSRIKKKIRQALPKKCKKLIRTKDVSSEKIVASNTVQSPFPKDRSLQLHFEKIHESLRPYNPIMERIGGLDTDKISDIIGISQGIHGTLESDIPGNIKEKIHFVENFILREVDAILKSAYFSNGIFIMEGFDFRSYNSQNTYRLISFLQNGESKACVLDSNNKVEYWVDNIQLVHYIRLFEQAIRNDPAFRDAFNLCVKGSAKPHKIYINALPEKDSLKTALPEVNRELPDACGMENQKKNVRKNLHLRISFDYINQESCGEEAKGYKSVSVVQDVKTIGPIKDELLQLYSENSKEAI